MKRGRCCATSSELSKATVQDAENMCDKLNRRLGLDRDAWTALVVQSKTIPHHPAGLH